MIKIAFFVEGQTEKIFIEQLLINIFGIEKFFFVKTDNIAAIYREIKKTEENNNGNKKYYVLIYDVSGDHNTVASKLRETGRRLLEKAGFCKIFGICDLYKKDERRSDKQKIFDGLRSSMDLMWFVITEEIIYNVKYKITSRQLSILRTLVNSNYPEEALIKKLNKIKLHKNIIDMLLEPMKEIKCKFKDKISLILAVMETEAWFLADHNLFSKIDPKLTPEYIKQMLGKDLIKDDPEEDYDKPANLVKDIYDLSDNKKYTKRMGDSCKIADNIDYDYLYEGTRGKKIATFHLLVDKLEEVLN
jgi:hypothetical protein